MLEQQNNYYKQFEKVGVNNYNYSSVLYKVNKNVNNFLFVYFSKLFNLILVLDECW